MSKRSLLVKTLGFVAGMSLFAWIIFNAFEKTQSVSWPPLPLPELAATLVLVLLAHGLHGLAWAVGARQLASKLTWADGISAYSISFLGRYIPGKVWQVGGLSLLARNKGASPTQIAGYSLGFLIVFQVLGVLVFLEAQLLQHFSWAWLLCLASAPLLAFALALPYCFLSERLVALLPERFRQSLQGALHQPFGPLVLNLTLLTLVWFLFATCGHLLVMGFAPEWGGTWGQSATATIGGLVAGFLVLIAPSGAGVRESTIALWLGGFGVSPVASIAIVVALRVTMSGGDLLWAGMGFLIRWRKSPAEGQD